MMAELFDVDVRTINEHLQNLFISNELDKISVIRNFRIVQTEDWANRLDKFLNADDREILNDSGKVTAEIAKAFAETEFEKYRVVQDQLFESDFDKHIKKQLGGMTDDNI